MEYRREIEKIEDSIKIISYQMNYEPHRQNIEIIDGFARVIMKMKIDFGSARSLKLRAIMGNVALHKHEHLKEEFLKSIAKLEKEKESLKFWRFSVKKYG